MHQTEHPGLDLDDVSAALANGESEQIRNPRNRRLLSRHEIEILLHLEVDQLQFLINTHQIIPIRIAGQERYDSRDIDRLIESYKATARRRLP